MVEKQKTEVIITKYQKTKGGISLYNKKKRIMRVILKIKRIYIKLTMINTQYNFERGELEKVINN